MELSFGEIVLVGLIAFLVFGPEDFVRRSRQFGVWVGRMRTQAQNFRIMAEEELTKKSGLAPSKQALVDDIESLREAVQSPKPKSDSGEPNG